MDETNNKQKKEYKIGVNKALWYELKSRSYVKNFEKADSLANTAQNHSYVKNASSLENLGGKILKRACFGMFAEEAKNNEQKEPEKAEPLDEQKTDSTEPQSLESAASAEQTENTLEKIMTPEIMASDSKSEYTAPKPAEEKPYEKQADKKPVQDAKTEEYLTLEDLAKIPGAKSVARLSNRILNLFREDNPASYIVKRDGKIQKSIYQASVKLFEYVLKDPSKAEETAKNWKEYLKQTEVKAFGELINKIVDCNEAIISIAEICKLPGTKTYKTIVQALLEYARLNPDKKTIELKPTAEHGGKSTYENKYRLTPELADLIFADKKRAEEIKYLLNEKKSDEQKKQNDLAPAQISIDDKIDEMGDEEPLAEFEPEQAPSEEPAGIDESYTAPRPMQTPVDARKKSKGQLRREREEAIKDDIRRFLVRKKSGLFEGNLRNIGARRTDLSNLYKSLPDHWKGFAKEVIDEWIRQEVMLKKESKVGLDYVAFNPQKLDVLKRYS